VFDLVKPLLKALLARGAISKDAYKEAGRTSTKLLFDSQPFSKAELEREVSAAVRLAGGSM
jgi:hypothetical protein